MERGYASEVAIRRALSEQKKQILFCPDCDVLANVERRPDAIEYRCGRCQTALIEPPPESSDKAYETSIIVTSRLPVPPDVQAAREKAEQRFGKYVILEQIGRGGIAIVYRAWDTYLHQFVALKRIKPGSSDRSPTRQTRVASLLNEAHNAIRLRHPNIVSIYDIGRVESEYYISMEFLDGRTMQEEIRASRENGSVSPYHDNPQRWLGVLYEVIHAVHYAHTRPAPTFHCDLKPGNIFITREGRACVLDFGLARQFGEFEDEGGFIFGTPAYMAPEQAAGRSDEVDARTDVYALGSILYELLSGHAPFEGSLDEILWKTLKERPPAPRERIASRDGSPVPKLSPELEALCLRCIEKDRGSRPETALAFAEEIQAIVERQGSTILERVRAPSTRRHEIPPSSRKVKVGAALFLGVLVLSALVAWAARLVPGERTEAASRAIAHLSAFRPELAEAPEPGGWSGKDLEPVGRRLKAVSAFKRRLMDAIVERRPVLDGVVLGGRLLNRVKFWKAKPHIVIYTAEGEPDETPWSALGPDGIRTLAQTCGLMDAAENRFGLALYCLSSGAPGEARELLQSLEGTPYEAPLSKFVSEQSP